MRIASSTVNESSEADSDLRAGASLAPAVTRAAAILDVLAEHPSAATPLSKAIFGASSAGDPYSPLERRRDGSRRRLDYERRRSHAGRDVVDARHSRVSVACAHPDHREQAVLTADALFRKALLDGLEVTYVARHDGRQPIRLASEIGRRLPASCTALGKATLASLDPDDLAERLRGVEALPTLTPNSHRRVADLLDDLDEVRRRGYAVDEEETAEGIVCLGVSIRRRSSADPPYGVSVTLLKARADGARREALAADLKRLARLLAHPLLVHRGDGDGRRP